MTDRPAPNVMHEFAKKPHRTFNLDKQYHAYLFGLIGNLVNKAIVKDEPFAIVPMSLLPRDFYPTIGRILWDF